AMVTWKLRAHGPSAYHAQVGMAILVGYGPRPKIILVQEAHESQFDTYLNGLKSQTGQQWYGVFKTHCPVGSWNGSSGSSREDEGVGIFTTYQIVASGYVYLPYYEDYH